jgi:hypothetical protein
MARIASGAAASGAIERSACAPGRKARRSAPAQCRRRRSCEAEMAAAPRAAMASWHLRGAGRPGNRPVACFSPERAEPRDEAPSAVRVAICRSGGTRSRSSGDMNASPTSVVVNPAARISGNRERAIGATFSDREGPMPISEHRLHAGARIGFGRVSRDLCRPLARAAPNGRLARAMAGASIAPTCSQPSWERVPGQPWADLSVGTEPRARGTSRLAMPSGATGSIRSLCRSGSASMAAAIAASSDRCATGALAADPFPGRQGMSDRAADPLSRSLCGPVRARRRVRAGRWQAGRRHAARSCARPRG